MNLLALAVEAAEFVRVRVLLSEYGPFDWTIEYVSDGHEPKATLYTGLCP